MEAHQHTELQSQCRGREGLRLAQHFHVDGHGLPGVGRQHREEVACGFAGFGVEGREGRCYGGEEAGEHFGRLGRVCFAAEVRFVAGECRYYCMYVLWFGGLKATGGQVGGRSWMAGLGSLRLRGCAHGFTNKLATSITSYIFS